MSEAPEQIWAWPMERPVYCASADPKSQRDATPYIRADHVDALLKAEREKALREAAEVCEGIRTGIVNGPMPERACFDYEQSILALIENPAG